MNSNRDPMLAPGQEGMLLFDDSADDSLQATEAFFHNAFTEQGDLMDDMFATSPQQSAESRSSLKEQATRAPQRALLHAGSPPEDPSEDSSSDDSAQHKRKASSESYQDDVDMLDGLRLSGRDSTLLQPVMSNEATQAVFSNNFDSNMINEAMAHDFDFDSAASSPSPIKSPHDLGTTTAAGLQNHSIVPLRHPSSYTSNSSTRVKTESIASPSPSMSIRRSPAGHADPRRARSTASASPAQPRTQVHIHRIPPKSRVETQIPIKITVSSLPAGVEKLHLPTHTISKPKLIARPTPERCPEMLELHSMLVCTSAMQDPVKRERAFRRAAAKTRQMEAAEKDILPYEDALGADDPDSPLNGGEVHICRGCITREKKRAARKKSKKPEEEASWASDEARRVIVFNTSEVRQWEDPAEEDDSEDRGRSVPSFPPGSKQVKMPMRIACYCRHHAEKLGFQVILTLKDHADQLVGQSITDPIIITDDHKAQPLAGNTAGNAGLPSQSTQWPDNAQVSPTSVSESQNLGQFSRNAFSSNDLASLQTMQSQAAMNPSGFSPFASTQPGQYDASKASRMNRSRQASPAGQGGPSTKRRKANAGPKLPESLVMTKAQNTMTSPTATSNGGISAPTSAVSPFGFTFPVNVTQMPSLQSQRAPSFPSGPPTPDSGTNDFWATTARAQSFDTNGQSQAMFSAPSSRIQSRAPSPTTQAMQNMHSAAPRLAQGYNVAPPQSQPLQRAPVINKIVPHEGPIAGGIEVTCLGSGFYNGLEVVFGNCPATTTTYWGETTLVCLLPPADRPGMVPVTFKHQYDNTVASLRPVAKQSFRYIDDEDSDIFRQAIIVLSQKMAGGQAGDPAEFARKALGSHSGDSGWSPYGSSSGQYRQMNGSGSSQFNESTEAMVMKCLEIIEMDESPYPANLDLPRSNGQTLLHLASSLGYQRLVAALLARGADPNRADRNGLTPLHVASLRNHPQIVRRLRFAGANPRLRTLLGFTPAQLSGESLVWQVLDANTHLRSRSFGAAGLHSRGNSLRSFTLATPPRSRASSVSRFGAEDEWDSSSDEDDADAEEPSRLVKTHSWHRSRRNSNALPEATITPPPMQELSENITPATVAAWYGQFMAQYQQFQQTVESMVPHIQMPTLPNIPPLAGMANYQAPAMVRRFSSFVPHRNSRPGSPAQSTGSAKDGEARWWDFFSSSQSNPSAPPAYDDIYPEDSARGLDHKASAVAATQSRNAKLEEDSAIASSLAASSTVTESGAVDQQDQQLKMAHARELKHLRSDRKLFFIWRQDPAGMAFIKEFV